MRGWREWGKSPEPPEEAIYIYWERENEKSVCESLRSCIVAV